MIRCAVCNGRVVGAAVVSGDDVVHDACVKKYRNIQAGRPHACPKCKTHGKVAHPTRTVTVQMPKPPDYDEPCGYNGCRGCAACQSPTYPVEQPEMVECDLCEGHGYLEHEPRAVTGVIRWERGTA